MPVPMVTRTLSSSSVSQVWSCWRLKVFVTFGASSVNASCQGPLSG